MLWSNLPQSAKSPRARLAGGKPRDSAWESNVWLADSKAVLFLDIETTGLSQFYDYITLVGYQFNGQYFALVRGDDDSHFRDALASASTLVTFNGTLFDIPFLKKTFSALSFPKFHIDLRFAARRVGLSGGQKVIERSLGLDLRKDVSGVDGQSAVILWHQYLRGDLAALRTLIEYNLADIRGMAAILDYVRSRYEATDLLIEEVSFGDAAIERRGHAATDSLLPAASRLALQPPSFSGIFRDTPAFEAVVVGIDLTGSEQRPSGVCVLRGDHAETEMIATDDDLVAAVVKANPALVSIDSPLSLPYGRISVSDSDPGRHLYGILRQSERTLKKRGINVYPCLLPSMQKLTARGIALATRLRRMGYPVIESYPGAAQDIMAIPRKGAGEHFLKRGLSEFGIRGAFETAPVKHDELDAITSAVVGSFFLAGKFEALCGPQEGSLIIPDLSRTKLPVVVGLSGRIAAGKTTTADLFQKHGFRYARFSEVIDEEIARRGEVATRHARQQIGWEIHQTRGQRWLCERLIERTADAEKVVIDGLRFPEDRIAFFERFGPGFIHIHIHADQNIRASRYGMALSIADFATLDSQPTEGSIEALAKLADVTIANEGTLEALAQMVESVIGGAPNSETLQCPFPS